MPSSDHPPPLGVILAGGRARRMGGRKAFIDLQGQPLIAHVWTRLRKQCKMIVISANDAPKFYEDFSAPVLPDALPDYPGPLAGVLAALDYAQAHGGGDVLSVPCDTPFLPQDLARRLGAAKAEAQAEIAVARSGGRAHWTIALWSSALADFLRATLARGQFRCMEDCAVQRRVAFQDWPSAPIDPFFNVNRPVDLDQAAALDPARAAAEKS